MHIICDVFGAAETIVSFVALIAILVFFNPYFLAIACLF